MGLKLWMYNHLVNKNVNIKDEYERNNIQYPEQHRKHRLKSWIWLIGLNIKYKILKISPTSPKEIITYVDTPVERVITKTIEKPVERVITKTIEKPVERVITKTIEKPVEKTVVKEVIKKYSSNAFLGSESKRIATWKEVHLVKRFLGYDYCVFPVWDVLLYKNVDTLNAFYNLVGLRLGISFFSTIRSRAEEEAFTINRKMDRKERPNLSMIYSVVEKYTGMMENEGIKAELDVLKEITTSNPFMKDFLQMLSYNRSGIIAVDDSVYTSEQIRNLLFEKGYPFLKDIIVSTEKPWHFNSEEFFDILISEYGSDSIIYMDKKENTDKAQKAGISVWEYFSPNELGNPYRAKGLPYYSGALYRSIVNQHMYCAHYNHSEKRELGYTYFGVFALGFVKWVKEVCSDGGVEKIFLLGGSDDIFLPLFREVIDTPLESIFFSEEFAVRYLVSENAFPFLEFYVDRRCTKERAVSYYLDIMGISELGRYLSAYGISTTDILKKDNEVYRGFLEFVLENKVLISNLYRNDFEAAESYLSSFKISANNMALVSVTDRGYRCNAFKKLFEKISGTSGQVITLTSIQIIGSHDVAYQSGLLKTYLYSGQNDYYGMKWPLDNQVRRYFESVYADCRPEFRLFHKSEMTYCFEFYDTNPVQFDKIREIQRGIVDFISDYKARVEGSMIPQELEASLVSPVIANIVLQPDYLKKHIPLIRE